MNCSANWLTSSFLGAIFLTSFLSAAAALLADFSAFSAAAAIVCLC